MYFKQNKSEIKEEINEPNELLFDFAIQIIVKLIAFTVSQVLPEITYIN